MKLTVKVFDWYDPHFSCHIDGNLVFVPATTLDEWIKHSWFDVVFPYNTKPEFIKQVGEIIEMDRIMQLSMYDDL